MVRIFFRKIGCVTIDGLLSCNLVACFGKIITEKVRINQLTTNRSDFIGPSANYVKGPTRKLLTHWVVKKEDIQKHTQSPQLAPIPLPYHPPITISWQGCSYLRDRPESLVAQWPLKFSKIVVRYLRTALTGNPLSLLHPTNWQLFSGDRLELTLTLLAFVYDMVKR